MLTIILLVLIIAVIIAFLSKKAKTYHSNWNTLIDNFEFSTNQFYTLLEQELKAQRVDNIRTETIILSEGGVFSSKRNYLRLTWKGYQYDICGAPFAKGFFVSWWLVLTQSHAELVIANVPLIGAWLHRKFYPMTYYKIDTASMFMSYAHTAVLNVIEQITADKGIRALSELERQPKVKDLLGR